MLIFAIIFFHFFLEARLSAEIFIFQPLPRFLSPLSCPGRPVPSVQPRLTGPCSCQADLSRLTCACFPVPVIMSKMSSPDCTAMDVLSRLPLLIVLLSCPALMCYPSNYCCLGCTILYRLSSPADVSLLFRLSCPGF
jgi:hypothetical protein